MRDSGIQTCEGYPADPKLPPLKCLVAQADPDKAGAAISVEIPPEISTGVDIGEGDRIRYLDMGELPTSTGSPCAFVDSAPRQSIQVRMLTAREITMASSTNPVSAWYPMKPLAHGVSGITSVGLNAIMLVSEK